MVAAAATVAAATTVSAAMTVVAVNIPRFGNGIHLTPPPLYHHVGSSLYNGNGLLLVLGSPFRHIPILKWIL